MIVKVHPEHPQGRRIDQAVEVLQAGGFVVYPTDTAYGIGCDVSNRRAIERLYQVKRREKKRPLSLVCGSIGDVATYAKVSNPAFRLLRRCLPGPYTFVLPAAPAVPRTLMPRRRTVGLRVPDHLVPRAIVEQLGRALVNTTVCFDGDPALTDPQDIAAQFGHAVDLVLDSGVLAPGRVSTLVDLCGEVPEILREGAGDVSSLA